VEPSIAEGSARRRPRRAAWLVAGSLLVAALGACDRNIAPYDPAEEPRQPDLRRIFPAPDDQGGPSDSPLAAGDRAPGEDAEPVVPAAPGRPGAAIRGTVYLAEDEAGGEGPAAGVLFVIARPAGARGGPPLAVVRVPSPRFPVDFEIGPDDVMMPTMRFEGPIALSARLDADGNASTQDEADRATASPPATAPGDAGVALRLQ